MNSLSYISGLSGYFLHDWGGLNNGRRTKIKRNQAELEEMRDLRDIDNSRYDVAALFRNGLSAGTTGTVDSTKHAGQPVAFWLGFLFVRGCGVSLGWAGFVEKGRLA